MTLQLRQIRTDRSLTQDQLAEMTGLSKGFLSQLETGARQPSVETIALLSSALKVSKAELISPTGFGEPSAPETIARRVLSNLDMQPSSSDEDFKLGTDGKRVQIIATVDRDGLDRLIRQLQIMKDFLDA